MGEKIKKLIVVLAVFVIAIHPFMVSSKTSDNKAINVMDHIPTFYREELKEKPGIINEIPPYFSWLDGGWMTPAKSQGNCGDCWDFAAVGALESVIKIREGMPELNPDLSEQYVLSCLPSAGGCHGGSPYLAYYYIKSTSADGNYHNGIVTEDCFPYEGSDYIPCSHKCSDWEEKLVPIRNYGAWIPDGSNEDRMRIKSQIMESGPVVSFMDVTQDFTNWGLYHHNSTDYYPYKRGDGVNHCIVILGWKDDRNIPHGGYWICKNSWGKYWGYDGFFNIEYGSLNVDSYEIVWADYSASDYNWPPVAISNGPYHGNVNEEITFDGSKSKDDGSVVSWQWDFGDGSTANGKIVKHSYEKRGIYTVTLTVKDDSGKVGNEKTAAFIETWKDGDEWIYDIKNIAINYSGINLNANIEKLDVVEKNGQLELKGRIKGNFNADLQPPLQFTGNLFFITLNGNIKMDENFGFEEANIEAKGLITVKFETFPIPIPIPVKSDINIKFTPTLHLIDFPLETKKTWNSEICNVEINGMASALFGLIKYPIEYKLYLGSLEGSCNGKEKINVEGGQYEAYKISYYDFLTLYYAPSIANIVKVEANINDNELQGELRETNYS